MSTLRVNTLQNASGVEVYTAKAWVNFNGTGTVAIRASLNVSSITDNGTGNYTVNFTSAIADANYSALATSGDNTIASTSESTQITNLSSTSVQIITATDGTGGSTYTLVDSGLVCVAVFR